MAPALVLIPKLRTAYGSRFIRPSPPSGAGAKHGHRQQNLPGKKRIAQALTRLLVPVPGLMRARPSREPAGSGGTVQDGREHHPSQPPPGFQVGAS